jgi:hypothetical protein
MEVVERPMPPEASLLRLRPSAEAQAILAHLRGPLEDRILGPIAKAGYDAPPPPVLTSRPGSLEVRYTDRGTTLTAARYEQDPLIDHDRGLVRAPRSQQKKLKALEKAGIDPDHVWVLRELPGVWRPGEIPPRMMGVETAETARSRHIQHLQVGAAAFAVGRALLYTAGAAVVLATGAVVAVGAITIAGVGMGAVAPLAVGLDPIVLAGVEHARTGAIAWTPIAAWDEIRDDRSW